jgi:hypothetical protein
MMMMATEQPMLCLHDDATRGAPDRSRGGRNGNTKQQRGREDRAAVHRNECSALSREKGSDTISNEPDRQTMPFAAQNPNDVHNTESDETGPPIALLGLRDRKQTRAKRWRLRHRTTRSTAPPLTAHSAARARPRSTDRMGRQSTRSALSRAEMGCASLSPPQAPNHSEVSALNYHRVERALSRQLSVPHE